VFGRNIVQMTIGVW